jgi:hypothetical protein
MWDQLTSADIDRVKQSLGARRAETIARHAEEVKSLEAKHLGEIHSLNAKEAEIELLNKLINDFSQEFMNEVAVSSAPTGTDQAALAETTVQNDEPGDTGMLVGEKDATASPLSNNTEPTPVPAQLQVLFPSPNFGRVRNIAS